MRDVLDVLAGRGEWAVACGDAAARLAELPPGCIHVCVTSPPYLMLRDYFRCRCDQKTPDRKPDPSCRECGGTGKLPGHDRQIGLEATLGEYLSRLAGVFDEVKRVLREDGLLALNVGDSYCGVPHYAGQPKSSAHGENRHDAKASLGYELGSRPDRRIDGLATGNLLGVPWRLAAMLQERGWLCRSVVCWRKLSPMPASLSGWRWQRCRVKVRAKERNTGKKGDHGHGAQANGAFVSQAQWRDCPGCPRCEPHGGLVLRKGSWRPTPSHEPVFLFAKSMGYFADGEPVRTQAAESTLNRDTYTRITSGKDGPYAVAHDHETPTNPAGANLRDYWDDVDVDDEDDPPDPDNMPDVLELGPEPLAEQHYAAFPTRLVSRILRFSTSERGVCGACGAPWCRVVDVKGGTTGEGWNDHDADLEHGRRFEGSKGTSTASARAWENGEYQRTTLGWRPTCACPDPAPVGAVVLDPFAGSGSTGVAARRLGLRFVGIDLAENYCAMARRRIGRALREGKRQKARKNEAPTLFDTEGT